MSGAVRNRQHDMRLRLDAALGVLGLHTQRLVAVRSVGGWPSAEASSASVSIAELEKLASRADHLIQLERLVGAYAEGSVQYDELAGKVSEWADAHDFSMLNEPEEVVPELNVDQ